MPESNYPIKSNGWTTIMDNYCGITKDRKKLEASLLLSESELLKQVKFEWVWAEIDQYKKSDSIVLDYEPKLKTIADAQAIINISRERLCKRMSIESMRNWQSLLNIISEIDPILVMACVPECVYRGFCPQQVPCQYIKTNVFKNHLEFYRTLPDHV